jgi:hypothetical protein
MKISLHPTVTAKRVSNLGKRAYLQCICVYVNYTGGEIQEHGDEWTCTVLATGNKYRYRDKRLIELYTFRRQMNSSVSEQYILYYSCNTKLEKMSKLSWYLNILMIINRPYKEGQHVFIKSYAEHTENITHNSCWTRAVMVRLLQSASKTLASWFF